MMPAQSAKRLKQAPQRHHGASPSSAEAAWLYLEWRQFRGLDDRRQYVGGALDSLLGGLWGKKAVGKRPKLH